MLLNTYEHLHNETLFYLVYLSPCLDLCLFLPYLWDLFFIFIFISIMINCIISWIQTHLIFCLFLEDLLLFLDDNVDEELEYFSNRKSSVSGCLNSSSFSICLIFNQFQSDVAYKSVAYKKNTSTSPMKMHF